MSRVSKRSRNVPKPAPQVNLFLQMAASGDTTVAASIGKRYLLGIDRFPQDYALALHHLKAAAAVRTEGRTFSRTLRGNTFQNVFEL